MSDASSKEDDISLEEGSSNGSKATNLQPLKFKLSLFANYDVASIEEYDAASIEEYDVAIIIPVKHKTLCNLEQQRHNPELCDVILQVENKEFLAHGTVLAASSEYFLKMFTLEMKKKYSKEVPMKTVTATAMSEILKSIYTQEISFSKANISNILHGASLMQFPSVANAAVSYIEQTIQIENCFWFRDLVLPHSFENLKEAVRCYFLAHIKEAAGPYLKMGLLSGATSFCEDLFLNFFLISRKTPTFWCFFYLCFDV